jgi:hypothetical protein
MVKWDRLTDKGTAPLKTEPKSATPRACTLCHFTRRKVPPYSLLCTCGRPSPVIVRFQS